MHFLKAESYRELDVLAKSDPVIGRAVDMIEILSEDEKMRLLADQREQARRDEVGRRQYAVQQSFVRGEAKGMAKGEARGMAKGKAEGKAELIIRMVSKGLSVAQIADLTDCTEEQVSGYLADA
jgi:predicted transposase/invertase (TIGR01784 family)